MSYSPSFFFFFSEGKIIGHSLITQKYYEIDQETFKKLQLLSESDTSQLSEDDLVIFQKLSFDKACMEVEWDGDIPSHIAHQASRLRIQNTPQLSEEEYVALYSEVSATSLPQIPEKERIIGDVLELPNPSLSHLESVSLAHCFLQRRTSREFISKSLDLDQISNILFSCFGPIHGEQQTDLSDLGIKDFIYRRSSPSATGLASCDAILWSDNINGLEKGLYSYNESNHTLIRHPNNISNKQLIYGMFDQFWLEKLSCGIFIVNDLRRTWIKDIRCRGYLASHQECGHVSQNILLSATAFKLQTWISGSFRDDFLQEKLSLSDYRFVSLFIGIGHGTGRRLSKKYIDLLEKTKTPIPVNR